jgi:TolB-like protein/class 3 adenylate cyclase/Flp pilus assembly protein TadD
LEFVFGDHLLDVHRRELRRGAELIAIEPQVFDLLVYLLQNRHRVVRKDDLVGAVWGGRIVSESTLTSRINAVRKAIGDSGDAQRLIRTLPRKGIRFIGVVREERTPAAPVDARSMAGEDSQSVSAVPRIELKSVPRLSIVVLPFANLSNDPDQEYFADAITEDLTTDLSRISGSFVIARNTAFTYKGKAVDAKQIGRELGVRYVMEGSVRRSGSQVRVNAQLVDAETGAHVWAERFETDRRNLSAAQSEITARLAQTLNIELIKDVGRRIEGEKSANPDAQDLVMRGWFWYHRPRSAAATSEAQRAFERALAIEPRLVEGQVGLARVLMVGLVGNFETRSLGAVQNDSDRAEQLLLEAIESDPNHSAARSTMGQLRRVQNRLAEARIELETAIAVGANDHFTHGQHAWTLLLLGEPQAAIEAGEKAVRVSPRDPTLWGAYLVLGWCQLLLNQAEPAIDLLIKSRAANPRSWVTHFGLAAALGLMGDLDGAKTVLAESLKLNPEVNSLARFRAYRPWGNPAYWQLYEKTAAAGLRRAGFPDEASEPDRLLATVLFTDIVDSTRRAAEIGDGEWHVLLDRHDEAVRHEIARFRGRAIKSLGDGFLATFDGPARAVRCAAAIIERVRPLGIEVRSGLHTGEIEIVRDDVGGIAVHIAARVTELAGSGEILVSSTVRDLVAGSGLEFHDRGSQVLRGLSEPLSLFAAKP